MAKKHWLYASTPGTSVGLMICCSCGKKITKGDFRYYETEDAYIPQCYKCGKNTPEWKSKDKEAERLEKEIIDSLSRDDPHTLLVRIKDAFFEGWYSYATPASAYNSPQEAWEESEAKLVHDQLLHKWVI